MLRLAKTESKKEMSLKKPKKVNSIQTYNNSALQKKHNMKQYSVTLSNDNLRNKKNASSSISPNNKNKKNVLLYLKDTISNSQRCESIRDTINNNKKNKTKYNFISGLNSPKEKRANTEENQFLDHLYKKDKIRKLISMSSDIFNLKEASTNLIRRTNIPDYYKIIYNKDNNDNYKDHLKNIFDNKNQSNYNNLSNNISSIGNSNKKNNRYNRINYFNRTQYNQSETNTINSNNGKVSKTNRRNIESVKYDIISNRKSKQFDKYNKSSGSKKPSLKIDDYEIIISNNYNKANADHLKNLMASNGLHTFGLREDGDVIAGQKGKFTMKIRSNKQNEIDNNKNINKASKQLSNFDVVLKKNIIHWGRKKTDITGKGWDEEIKNGLY